MKNIKLLALSLLLIAFTLSGCGTVYKNGKILKQDDAKVAYTINKDLSNTLINTHTGERVKPCEIDLKNTDRPLDEIIKNCSPDDYNPNGKIVSDTRIIVKKGSICIIIVAGSRGYMLCQPPHNLGF